MLELTGMGSVLRGIGFLYWALAVGALGAALYFCKGARGKIIWSAIVLAVFSYLPGQALIEQHKRDTYAKEAWAYFKKKCETEAGEKIYKTYTGVKSVLVVKALPPAEGDALYDQFWMGDPYSNATPGERAESAALKLASPRDPIAFDQIGRGFDFVESLMPPNAGKEDVIIKYSYSNGARDHSQQRVDKPISHFGISWEDISTREDRKYWVAGSRLRVVNLVDNSIVAERVGYFIEAGFGSRVGARTPWLTSRGPNTTCPSIRNRSFEDRWFILKVLNPLGAARDGK